MISSGEDKPERAVLFTKSVVLRFFQMFNSLIMEYDYVSQEQKAKAFTFSFFFGKHNIFIVPRYVYITFD